MFGVHEFRSLLLELERADVRLLARIRYARAERVDRELKNARLLCEFVEGSDHVSGHESPERLRPRQYWAAGEVKELRCNVGPALPFEAVANLSALVALAGCDGSGKGLSRKRRPDLPSKNINWVGDIEGEVKPPDDSPNNPRSAR